MSKLELMSPAGSLESIYAAARAGADAVYFGGGDFNARRNAKNLSNEELVTAIKYLKVRNKHSYITVNTLLTDRELKNLIPFLRVLNEAGASAVIVQDLAVASIIKKAFPDMPIHASTQLTVHNLDGALAMKELGFSRVVLSRELPFEEIKYITENCGIETEIFCHGALCMCYSGQCYFSALVGGRSGNRGLCAQPCRMTYSYENGAVGAHLSLKDLCLAKYIRDIKAAGVSCVKIEGRMKRPEYTAYVTNVYRRLIDENRGPTQRESENLKILFSRDGFTDGFFTGNKGGHMFGSKDNDIQSKELKEIYKEAQILYTGDEAPCVSVDFVFTAKENERMRLAASAGGNLYECFGGTAERANFRPTTADDIKNSLRKTGGTIFAPGEIEINMDEGLKIPLSVINSMRRQCLDALTAQRKSGAPRRELEWHFGYERLNTREAPQYIYSFTSNDQITKEALKSRPAYIYIPLLEYCKNLEGYAALQKAGQKIGVVLPRIIFDSEMPKVRKMLEEAEKNGANAAVCTNVGHPHLLKDTGFEIHGDFGLNVFNSQTMKQFKSMGVMCQTLSFELNFPQIRDISKCVESQIIVYGRLPLMVTESCMIKNRTGSCSCEKGRCYLKDKTGRMFPVVREEGCRNTIYNSDVLYYADKQNLYRNLGLSYARLNFTVESPSECSEIIRAYTENTGYMPNKITRGLYQRGVE